MVYLDSYKKRSALIAVILAGLGIGYLLKQGQKSLHLAHVYTYKMEKAKTSYQTALKNGPYAAISSAYITNLTDEYNAIIADFTRDMNVSLAEWEQFKIKERLNFDKQEKNQTATYRKCADQEICKSIYAIAQKLSINPADFEIVSSTDIFGMAALSSIFYINPENYKQLYKNQAEFDALIAHEFQHMLHDDSFNQYCMQVLMAEKNIDQENQQKYVGRYNHFMEKRADICAGLLQESNAQELNTIFNRYASISDAAHPTHPQNSVRAAYCNKLHEQLTQLA